VGAYPQEKLIHELFEKQVSVPGSDCGGVRGGAADYAQLNARAISWRDIAGPRSGTGSASGDLCRAEPGDGAGIVGDLKRAERMCRWIRAIRPSGWRTC